MASLPIYNRSGAQVGTYDIVPADVAPRINKQLLHEAVVMYQANLRQGNQKTKGRGEIAGSTKKLFKQKGTGNARVGNRRTGKRRGGGHTHAIEPRDYSYRLPKKAVQLATRMAIASKLENNQVVVVDELNFAGPKTRDVAAMLKALKLVGSTLVTTEAYDLNLVKSVRNIDKVTIAPVSDLNALSVLQPKRMLVTKGALDLIRKNAAAAGKSRRDAAEQGS